MTVLLPLPSESCNKYVRREFLKGIWLWRALSACITSPSDRRERLIFWASFSLSPSAPDFQTLSEPARSTRFNLPDERKVQSSWKWNEENPLWIPVSYWILIRSFSFELLNFILFLSINLAEVNSQWYPLDYSIMYLALNTSKTALRVKYKKKKIDGFNEGSHIWFRFTANMNLLIPCRRRNTRVTDRWFLSRWRGQFPEQWCRAEHGSGSYAGSSECRKWSCSFGLLPKS